MTDSELSPALAVVSKRIRAARKKLNRIHELEAAQAAGKQLTPDQLPTLAAKAGVLAVIDELGRIEPLLKEALREEISHAEAHVWEQVSLRDEEKARQEEEARVLKEQQQLQQEEEEARALAKSQAQQQQEEQAAAAAEEPAAEAAAPVESPAEPEAASVALPQASQSADVQLEIREALRKALGEVLGLLYFSQLFDPILDFSPDKCISGGERAACLCHDQRLSSSLVPGAPLSESDLMFIAWFGRSLINRLGKPMSHREHLDAAVDKVLELLLDPEGAAISDELLLLPGAQGKVEVSYLLNRLQRLTSSEFFVVRPVDVPMNQPPLKEAPPPGGITSSPHPHALHPQGPLPPPGMPGLAAAAAEAVPEGVAAAPAAAHPEPAATAAHPAAAPAATPSATGLHLPVSFLEEAMLSRAQQQQAAATAAAALAPAGAPAAAAPFGAAPGPAAAVAAPAAAAAPDHQPLPAGSALPARGGPAAAAAAAPPPQVLASFFNAQAMSGFGAGFGPAGMPALPYVMGPADAYSPAAMLPDNLSEGLLAADASGPVPTAAGGHHMGDYHATGGHTGYHHMDRSGGRRGTGGGSGRGGGHRRGRGGDYGSGRGRGREAGFGTSFAKQAWNGS